MFLMVADFYYGWAWNTVDVLRPDIRASFGLSLTEVSLMYTAQSAGALVGAVVIGQLADRLGRRNAIDFRRAALDSASVAAKRGAQRQVPTQQIAARQAPSGMSSPMHKASLSLSR